MGRSLDIFDDEQISIDQIIDGLKDEDENDLVGNSLEKSIQTVRSLPSINSRALVLDELIDILLDSDLVYLAKRFGDEALDSALNVKIRAQKAKTMFRIATTFSSHDLEDISQKIYESALEETKKLEDDELVVDVFISIVEKQLENQLVDQARQNLDRALSAAMNLAEDGEDVVPLSLVAELKARLGEDEVEELCEETLRLSDKFGDQTKEWWIKCSIAKAFLRLERDEKAWPLIEEISENDGNDVHLMELGITLSQEGKSESAVEIAGDISNENLRYPLMRVIASDLIRKGFTKDALKLIETIEDIFERDLVYKELVEKLVEKGEYGRAYKYLDMMEDKDVEALTHKEIGLSYQREGKLQRATDHILKAREIAEESERDSIKLELVDAMMKIDKKYEAVDLSGEIDTAEERAIAFGIIAGNSE